MHLPFILLDCRPEICCKQCQLEKPFKRKFLKFLLSSLESQDRAHQQGELNLDFNELSPYAPLFLGEFRRHASLLFFCIEKPRAKVPVVPACPAQDLT